MVVYELHRQAAPHLAPASFGVNTRGEMAATLDSLTQRLHARRELPSPDVRRTLRRLAGASQADVAEVVGVSRQAVQLWEAGTRTPRGTNLDAYLEVLRAFRRAMSEDRGP
jgi:DNA-binding XRE family transcriptional regulator